MLNREEYNKICVANLDSRSGLTHKVVTEIGNYRFTEVCNNINNSSKYFLLENTTTCGGGSDCQGQALAINDGIHCLIGTNEEQYIFDIELGKVTGSVFRLELLYHYSAIL